MDTNPILSDAIEKYLEYTRNPRTREYYKEKCKSLLDYGMNLPISEIDREWVISFIERRLAEKPDGVRTCKKEVDTLRYILNFYGIPVTWVTPRHYFSGTKSRKSHCPSDDEFAVIWHEADPHVRVALALAIFGGLRPEEMHRMRRSDVDDAFGVLRIRAEARKRDRPNLLPLSGILKDALDAAGYLRFVPDAPLMSLSKRALDERLLRLSKRDGVTNRMGGFQSFRRLVLRWLTEGGFQGDKGLITGHSPVGSQNMYADDPTGYIERKQEMIDYLEERFRKAIGG